MIKALKFMAEAERLRAKDLYPEFKNFEVAHKTIASEISELDWEVRRIKAELSNMGVLITCMGHDGDLRTFNNDIYDSAILAAAEALQVAGLMIKFVDGLKNNNFKKIEREV